MTPQQAVALASLAPHTAIHRVMTSPALAVPFYLMSLWLYDQGRPVLSDQAFDALCAFLNAWWADIEHVHKHLIRRESLAACTSVGVDVRELPDRVKGAALHWRRSEIAC